jgi:GTP-binding protein
MSSTHKTTKKYASKQSDKAIPKDLLKHLPRKPVIALVGRPNVGKSTLFNRLTKSRDAIVFDVPGLTRDRHYGQGVLGRFPYILIDTGGFEPIAKDGIMYEMAQQTKQAILEADAVIFLTDGRVGATPMDKHVADILRRSNRPTWLAVNKSEGISAQTTLDFFHLGIPNPIGISSAHGEGVKQLVEDVVASILKSWDIDPELIAPKSQRNKLRQAQEDNDAYEEQFSLPPETIEPEITDETNEKGDNAYIVDEFAEFEDDLTDADLAAMEAQEKAAPKVEKERNFPLRLAIAGRPNVGKSTLINSLLGENRVIAFDQPGTTRDAIEIEFSYNKRAYVLIDTAGIRRKGKVFEAIEKFSVIKTLQAIETCHVAVLMLDAQQDIADQDAHIARYIVEAGRALVIAVNKWDGLDSYQRQRVKDELLRRLPFLQFAELHFISALLGKGLDAVMKSVNDAYAAATRKLSTPQLTRVLRSLVDEQQPPRQGMYRPKLRYAHQGGENPPIVVIHGNRLDAIPAHYLRFLENRFRQAFELQGTPLRIELRTSVNPYKRER